MIGSECAAILAKLDQQHFGQSSIMRSRTVAIEDILPLEAASQHDPAKGTE